MIRIYGLDEQLAPLRERMSQAVHACMMEALGLPEGKRAHRFIRLQREDFVAPAGRSDAYTVLEVNLIEGRTPEARRRLIKLLFARFESELGIQPTDLEITLFESPGCNWGFRGLVGDESDLDYEITV